MKLFLAKIALVFTALGSSLGIHHAPIKQAEPAKQEVSEKKTAVDNFQVNPISLATPKNNNFEQNKKSKSQPPKNEVIAKDDVSFVPPALSFPQQALSLTPWPDLETKFFAEATQKNWATLIITNESGEKRYYKKDNNQWVRKNSEADLTQPTISIPTPLNFDNYYDSLRRQVQEEKNQLQAEIDRNKQELDDYFREEQAIKQQIRDEVAQGGGFITESQLEVMTIQRLKEKGITLPVAPVTTSLPTAICNDYTYSYSQNRSGTCSYHGGVAEWLY